MTEIPTYSECVIGYRQWRIDDWVLSPVSIGTPWRPGVNHARCHSHEGMWLTYGPQPTAPERHAAPHKDCDCGLYAFHTPPELWASNNIIGAVAAWGDLRVHADGFRAEYAQIVALVGGDVTANGGLHELARFYGVPLVPRDLLEMEAQRHGQPLPADVRPEKQPAPEYPLFAVGNVFVGSTTVATAPSGAYYWVGGGGSMTPTWTPPEEDKPKIGKRAANRQGPQRKQRPPRNINPRKGR